MKLTYTYSREALKNRNYADVVTKKNGNIPAKRKTENTVAVLKKLQLKK